MKNFFKKLFCKHKYKITRIFDNYEDWDFQNKNELEIYKKCKKCWIEKLDIWEY